MPRFPELPQGDAVTHPNGCTPYEDASDSGNAVLFSHATLTERKKRGVKRESSSFCGGGYYFSPSNTEWDLDEDELGTAEDVKCLVQ